MYSFSDAFDRVYFNFLGSVPNILKVILVLFVGWLIARALQNLTEHLLKKTQLDERLLGKTIAGDTNKFLAQLVYYIVMVFVLMSALELMGVSQVLDPLRAMLHEFFTFIPNLLAAGVLVFVGYTLARFVTSLITIGGTFLGKIAENTGFKDTNKIVSVIRQVVFLVIFIPFIIFALGSLGLEAISQPANQVLADILTFIPNLLAAAAVIALFVVGGKYLTVLLKNLLESIGINHLADKLYLRSAIGTTYTLSALLADIAYFYLVFFAIISGVELLGLDHLVVILQKILFVTGQILFGLVVLILGNYISKIASNMVAAGEGNRFLGNLVRFVTLGLFLAMSLRAMDIAPEIVNMAFGLTLGSVAVVVALAYGLGGREAAGEHFKEIIAKLKGKS